MKAIVNLIGAAPTEGGIASLLRSKVPSVPTGAAGTAATKRYQRGGFVDRDQFAMLHAGETITPGEGAETVEKQTKATDELTEQMKKLNDLLDEQITTRMGGLGPGLGVGPGVVGGGFRGGGGGFAAGAGYAAGAGSVSPMGALPGLGAVPGLTGGDGTAGGGTGGGGGAGRGGGGGQPYSSHVGAGGITSDATVPGNILETAKHVAATQGPAGVEAFMRSQVIRRLVVGAASLPRLSSRLRAALRRRTQRSRRIGATGARQIQLRTSENIAVANRGVRTGATGSHVTFVSAIDPKTGRFTGLGGNQGGTLKESSFATGGYTFRKPTPAEAEKMAAMVGATPQTAASSSIDVSGAAAVAGEGGAAFLAKQRAPFAQELEQKPWLKRHLAGLATLEHEGDRTAVVESLYNRTALVNQERSKRGLPPVSLEHMINPGGSGSFYGPERAGIVDSKAAQLARDPAAYKRALADIDAGASSNLLRGATDQGSGHDPNVNWLGGRVVRQGEVYNDWEYGGSHKAAQEFRERQQAQVAAADRASMDRQMAQKVEGSGKLDVNVNAPKGTTVNAEGKGLFKTVNVARNTQMDKTASQAEPANLVEE
jgi:hypothetical protein